jgi:hypothetical protein
MSKNKRDREEYIGLWVSKGEKQQIRDNATRGGQTISSFIRSRALKELSINEMLDFLVMFISQRDGSGDKATWKKWDLKKLSKPFDVKLQSVTMGMTEEEKAKFKTHWNEKAKEASGILGELKSLLEGRYVE